jgi:hypothetical protein
MIPTIIEDYFLPYKNKFSEIFTAKVESDYKNKFKIHTIKLGPFITNEKIDIDIENIFTSLKFSTKYNKENLTNIDYKYIMKEKYLNGKRYNFIIIKLISDLIVIDDINIKINSKSNNFNFWVNFFYLSLEKYLLCINKILSLNLIMKNNNFKLYTAEETRHKNNPNANSINKRYLSKFYY